jgi:hypothetical protein
MGAKIEINDLINLIISVVYRSIVNQLFFSFVFSISRAVAIETFSN